MNDVLLTYGWVRSSYSALRNLTSHDLKVITSDSTKIGMCQFSKYSSGFEKYISHYDNEHEFVKNIIDICKRKEIKLILPSHNETEIISRNRSLFKKSLVEMVPDESHCKIFNNKSNAYDLVSKLGIPIPKRFEYKNPNLISDLLKEKKVKKTVIKLLTGNSAKGVFYANNPDDAQSIVNKLISKYELSIDRYPQIEEYILGDGYGCSVLYHNGVYVSHFTHKRLRDKIDTGGTSTLRKSSFNLQIEEATKTIFNAIGWNGLAMCEFKVCPTTGKFWFIEVNPRMWGSISLAIESGVEFPYLAWLCASQGTEKALEYASNCEIKKNWQARWLLGDIFVFFKKIFNLKFKEALNILQEKRSNSLDDFFWDDPLPFLGELLAYLFKVVRKRNTNPVEEGMIG